MWTRQLLKENGRTAFNRNRWLCVAASAIAMLLGGSTGTVSFNFEFGQNIEELEQVLTNMPTEIFYIFGMTMLIGGIIGICVAILVSNIVMVGCNRFFLENREHRTDVGKVFWGFQGGRYGTNVWMMFWRTVYVFAWSLLLVIPGIIKSYQYFVVPYILAENPEIDKKRLFELSKKMMKGHKWELFVLQLSFLGWHILGACTFGILSIVHVNPYMNATYAEFYSALKAEATQNGIVLPGELPGVVPVVVEDNFDTVI